MKALSIPDEEFDRLASGDGGTAGVLGQGRYSKRLILLHDLRSTARGQDAKAFSVLGDAHRRAGHVVGDVLLDPHVGAWATACLSSVAGDDPAAPEHMAHVGAIAAAAAWRAGMGFDVTTHAEHGRVFLPTLGTVDLGQHHGRCRIRSSPRSEGLEVWAGDTSLTVPRVRVARDAGRWQPLRRIRCEVDGLALDVAVNDLGPYRDCGELAIDGRLDAATFAEWHDQFERAWTLLARHHRGQAEAVAGGVSSLVPLRATESAEELSATCHSAGGAVALTTPRQPLSAALALVHEFQHTKLSALLDLVPLADHSPEKCLHAPWRPDPRPLRGLLQGTYAFLGLTRFWNDRRRSTNPSDLGVAPGWAEMEVALGRLQVGEALVTLGKSSDLRPLGQQFVDGMARRLSEVRVDEISAEPHRLARLAARDHYASWRMRNLRPDPDQVAALADAWLQGRSCRWPDELRVEVSDGGGSLASAARLSLFRHRLAFPHRRTEPIDGVQPGDLALLDGGPMAARSAYADQVGEDPDDMPSWAGLAVAEGETTVGPTALGMFPEWVIALHRVIRDRCGMAPGPETLASWIACR